MIKLEHKKVSDARHAKFEERIVQKYVAVTRIAA
jgi:hypothetical protein